MKVLVTGGSGFIGQHLVNRLLEQGHGVVIFDKAPKVRDNAKVVEGDVRDADDVIRAMRDCEIVFHLAAIVDARNPDDDLVYSVNFIGSKNVFEAAKETGVKVVFCSTAAVYGDSKLAKEDDECHPINQYGKSKLRAEKICPPDAFIARLFNVYGPGGNSAVNDFCRLIPQYKEVALNGHGTQTRDFIYIDDVVRALLLGMEQSGTYNVGTGKEVSLLQVIDAIHAMTKAKPDLKFLPAIQGDIQRSRADITKIMATGWRPKVELQEGIEIVLRSLGVDLDLIKQQLK